MSLIQPAATGLDLTGDLEDARDDGEGKSPICDEAHLQVFSFWYQMGGLKRPLTPVEAAETPAPLALDFIYLLRRMRRLNDVQTGLNDFIRKDSMRLSRSMGRFLSGSRVLRWWGFEVVGS